MMNFCIHQIWKILKIFKRTAKNICSQTNTSFQYIIEKKNEKIKYCPDCKRILKYIIIKLKNKE